jgi:hypothetical protein
MTSRVAILDNRQDRRERVRARVREALVFVGAPWSGAVVDVYEEADELQRAGSFELVLVHKGRDQAGALDVAAQTLARGGAVVIFGGLGLERAAIDLHGRVHVERDGITAETVERWSLADILGDLLASPQRPVVDRGIGARQDERLAALGDPAIVYSGEPVVDRILALRSGGHFAPIVVLDDGPRISSDPLVARWLEDRSIVAVSVASSTLPLADALDQLEALDPRWRDPTATARRCLEHAAALLFSRAVDVDSHDLCGRTAPLRVAAAQSLAGLGGLALFDAVRDRIRNATQLSPVEAVLAAAWREILASTASLAEQPAPIADPFEAWIVDDHAEAGWTALLGTCWPGARIRGMTSAGAVDQALAAGDTPDLAIVDLYLDPVRDEALHRGSQLHRISGVGVRQRLHEVKPRMPIFLLTASDSFDAVEMARGAGFAVSPPVGILRKPPLWSGPFVVGASQPAAIDAFAGVLMNVHRWGHLVTAIGWLSAPPALVPPWWHGDLTAAGASLADLAGRMLVHSGALRFDSTLGEVAGQFSEWCAPKDVGTQIRRNHPADHPRLYLTYLFWRAIRNVLAHHYWSTEALSVDDRLRLVAVAVRVSALLWDHGDAPAPISVPDALASAGERYWLRLGAGINAMSPRSSFYASYASGLLNSRVWPKWPVEGAVNAEDWNMFRSAIVDQATIGHARGPFEFLELLLGCWLHVAALLNISLLDRTLTTVVEALAVWRGR